MELYLQKTIHGLSPEPNDTIAEECLAKYKLGARIKCKISKQRNPLFHRKFFALLNTGYEYWVPGDLDSKWGAPQKNFEQYREDVTILAGYYEITIRLNGETRVRAKSISFGSMDDEEFSKLYSAVIDVLLQKIFIGYKESDITKMVEQKILNFA